MKKIFLLIGLFTATIAFSQDSFFARKIVDTLTSPAFWGRGYTKNGMQKAAEFLSAQMKLSGLMPVKGDSYFQNFTYPVNTFPGKMEVSVDGKLLAPGTDFIVAPQSRGVTAKGVLIRNDSATFIDPKNRIIVSLENKLTASVAPEQADFTAIQIDKKALTNEPSQISVDIENSYVKNFKAANVCGLVKGSVHPDSIIAITAHYDHLGGLGSNTYFPGANDNASGISLLLGLAKYYAANPPSYSILFICFAGEEAGLIGSRYFTEHPLLPLKNIRFLINTDLAGTGDEGITVVNATEFPNEFALLNQVNDAGKYVAKINARGKAANSDHYWFTEKGVPAFFIYTLGGIKAYHDVYDISATLPLSEYDDLFKLIVQFNEKLMN